jgi:type I restriction enzyme S subunit
VSGAVKPTGAATLRRFRPYPAYKVSGVEWLGEIPVHWTVSRISELTTLVNGYPFESEYFVRTDGAPLIRIRDLNNTETEVNYVGPVVENVWIEPGDVIIGMDGDFNVARWRGRRGLLNQRMCCLRMRGDADSRFIAYLLPIPLKVINDLTYSTTVKHLSSGDVRKVRLGRPPAAEQRAIANFLDRETAKIDASVAKKERLIELLQEKRAALITRAVTKGLDPKVPMKDSGVDWLGAVPAHWDVERVKWVARMESGHTPDKKVDSYWVDGNIPWVSLADTGQLREVDYIEDTAVRTTSDGIAHSSARILPPGTVVFSRDATIGLCAITRVPMAVSQHFIGWVCGPRLEPEYLLFAFRSMTQELERLTMGATVRTIGMPDVRSLTTPVPPVSEQQKIVVYVREGRAQIDTLVKKIQHVIDRLREIRAALISAAVTGKIDVREEAA